MLNLPSFNFLTFKKCHCLYSFENFCSLLSYVFIYPQVPLREAVDNFFHSPAWKEMKQSMQELYQFCQYNGWGTCWSHLISLIDPTGESHAYRVRFLLHCKALPSFSWGMGMRVISIIGGSLCWSHLISLIDPTGESHPYRVRFMFHCGAFQNFLGVGG